MASKMTYSRIGSLATTFQDYFQATKKKMVDKEKKILIQLNDAILALTPVWEGELIVNWTWSTKAPKNLHIEPVQSPADPGHTNEMALGTEPRRRANSVRPKQSLAGALTAKDPVDIFLTNASPIAVDAEYGLIPTPDKSRSANGIVRLAIKQVMGKLR